MKKVMCFGTFDKLHQGHLSYLKQAKKYGDCLIVVVARDKNVKELKKRLPVKKENCRLKDVKNLKIVNKAVLGALKDKLKVIRKHKPDIICLGYDQPSDINELKNIFKGKIIRLLPYKEEKYKSSLIK
ncbi:MAG: adenylyltransferase/cytidyltransferase family protein [Patescibacteria group bacterium]